MVAWNIKQYYCSDWKIVFRWSGINIPLQASSLHIEAAPEPFKVAFFKLVCLIQEEDKEGKLGLAVLRECKQFGMNSFPCVAWLQYCDFNMYNANLLRKLGAFLKCICNMLKWAFMTRYPQTYKEEPVFFFQKRAQERAKCVQ